MERVMGQVNLKKFDVIDVTKDIKNAWISDELVVRTGPKQGDKVWVRNFEHLEWKPAEYIAFFTASAKNVVVCEHCLGWFDYMTTTDPYALKYTLTTQEARHAAIDGAKVRHKGTDEGFYYEFVVGFGFRVHNSKGEFVRTLADLPIGYMYAIVEE